MINKILLNKYFYFIAAPVLIALIFLSPGIYRYIFLLLSLILVVLFWLHKETILSEPGEIKSYTPPVKSDPEPQTQSQYDGFVIVKKGDKSVEHESGRTAAEKTGSERSVSEKQGSGLTVRLSENDDNTPLSETPVTAAEGFRIPKPRSIDIIPSDIKDRYDEYCRTEKLEGKDTREITNTLLDPVFESIADYFSVYSIILFWYDKGHQVFKVAKSKSYSEEIIDTRLELENDLISQVVTKESPVLLSTISAVAEKDNIRYYFSSQQIKSVVGVPVYFKGRLIGVLVCDSQTEDAFGEETILNLARYTKIISYVIELSEKFHFERTAKNKLSKYSQISSEMLNVETFDDLYQIIETTFKDLLNPDYISFIFNDPQNENYTLTKVFNFRDDRYISDGIGIDLFASVAGKAIQKCETDNVADLNERGQKRFSPLEEDIDQDGSFLVVPFAYKGKAKGALCFEKVQKGYFTAEQGAFVSEMLSIMSASIFATGSVESYKQYISIDFDTKLLVRDAFIERAQQDVFRTSLLKIPGTLVLIKIDEFIEQENLFEGNPVKKIVKSVAEILKNETDPNTAVIGRLNRKEFGMFLFNKDSNEVFMWAEKLRGKIAKQPVHLGDKQTTFTVSIGISGVSTGNFTEVYNAAELALQKCVEQGGNKVKHTNT